MSVFSNSVCFSQKNRKSESLAVLGMQDKTVKPQIPPDLSHFHMRNYVLLVGILGLKQLFEM